MALHSCHDRFHDVAGNCHFRIPSTFYHHRDRWLRVEIAKKGTAVGRIELRDISKSFGPVTVIRNVNLEINDSELMVFVGPSGCGKSTLLRLIAGLDKPTAGEILIDTKVVNHLPASDRGLAMVFQSYALYPHMSVTQNLAFGLENTKLPKAEIKTRIAEAARMLDIETLMDRRPGQLSGGQRQRVAIGRAIVRSPTAFLLDEPLSNLDAKLRVVMRSELSALHARLNKTMIYVTHDQIEAMTLADRIVVLRDGRIEQVGTPLQLYNSPANLFVAGFIGAPGMNFITAEIVRTSHQQVRLILPGGQELAFDVAGLGTRPGDRVTLGIRPQNIRLTSKDSQNITAEVTLVEALGSETIIHSRTSDGQQFVIVVAGQKDIEKGGEIHLEFESDQLHFFGENEARLETDGA
jgi:ABC-type sugar transport system ATPase subunit